MNAKDDELDRLLEEAERAAAEADAALERLTTARAAPAEPEEAEERDEPERVIDLAGAPADTPVEADEEASDEADEEAVDFYDDDATEFAEPMDDTDGTVFGASSDRLFEVPPVEAAEAPPAAVTDRDALDEGALDEGALDDGVEASPAELVADVEIPFEGDPPTGEITLDDDEPAAAEIEEPEPPTVRSHEERMKAVVEVVESVTPERAVRTPAERRAAVQAVLEARQREIQSRRRQREVEQAAASEPAPAGAPRPVTLSFPERPPEMAAAVVKKASRERRPRSDAERLADAKQAALEELERRRHETAARNRRILEDRQ